MILVSLYINRSFRCTAFLGLMSTWIISLVQVADDFISIGFNMFLTCIMHYWSTSPSCWSWFVYMKNLVTMYGNFCKQMLVLGVYSQVSLIGMTSKFSTWINAISSTIFDNSDCTLAVSTFSRLLGCISLPVFVAGGFSCGGDRGICGVWSALGCCCPWQSSSFLQVAVVGIVGDRLYWLL